MLVSCLRASLLPRSPVQLVWVSSRTANSDYIQVPPFLPPPSHSDPTQLPSTPTHTVRRRRYPNTVIPLNFLPPPPPHNVALPSASVASQVRPPGTAGNTQPGACICVTTLVVCCLLTPHTADSAKAQFYTQQPTCTANTVSIPAPHPFCKTYRTAFLRVCLTWAFSETTYDPIDPLPSPPNPLSLPFLLRLTVPFPRSLGETNTTVGARFFFALVISPLCPLVFTPVCFRLSSRHAIGRVPLTHLS